MSTPGFQNRRTNFTMLANAMLRNPALSLKAKGLLAVMLSFPDDWTYYMSHIEGQSSDGRDAHRNALKELETAGYIVRRQARDERGRLSTTHYSVSDEGAHINSSDCGLSGDGKSGDGKSGDGKTPTTKTDSTKTDLTKTDTTPRGLAVTLPDWLPEEAWGDFLAYRKGIKAPVNELSARRLLATLEKLRREGHDPVQVIDQTISTGKWTGLFPLKDSRPAARRPQTQAEANQKFLDGMEETRAAIKGVFDE